jgi:superfamily II DNA or RNA helicase
MKQTILKLHQRICVAKATTEALGTFCYPTGTGKTLAEAHIIAEHIKAGDLGIYVVLAPRIMLGVQLFSELYTELVIKHGINCLFYSNHSGRSPSIKKMTKKLRDQTDDVDDNMDAAQVYKELIALGLTEKQIKESFGSGTSVEKLKEAAHMAKVQNRPLIVVSTYHSAERITMALSDISILLADEGHNAVSIGFTHIHEIPARKRFYFTATLKFTDGGGNGLGMQNEEKFGAVLDSLSPAEAVVRGLIVRPRVHYVEIAGVADDQVIDADFKAIEASFISHGRALNGIGPKLLVAVRGVPEIQEICQHTNYFERLRTIRPNLFVFDISSRYGARINGVGVERDDFLKQLQSLKDHQEAIILHYDILSEGIDVPGITGVMPLRNLGTSKFLQTLGRATRLHYKDRVRLSDESTAEVEAQKLDWFVKPYAWLVLPCYGGFGGEIQASAEEYVRQLRTFGWVPGEGDLLTEAGGEGEPWVIKDVHESDKKKLPGLVECMGQINQRFEDREKAEEAYILAQALAAAEAIEKARLAFADVDARFNEIGDVTSFFGLTSQDVV